MNFDKVYASKRWSDQGNGSGPGSALAHVKPIFDSLKQFIEQHEIKSIVDVSCGGFAWWPSFFDECKGDIAFHGFDIAETVIADNRCKFPAYKFDVLDGTNPNTRYPLCDLIVVRHTLNHLSLKNARQLLQNVLCSGCEFVACTSHAVSENPLEDTRRAAPGINPGRVLLSSA